MADELAQGAIEMAGDNLDDAISHFETTVRIQDELPYTEPPFWYFPSRHTLGQALLAADRPLEAEANYRKDLEQYPRNGWAVFGLIESLKAQDKNSKELEKKFQTL